MKRVSGLMLAVLLLLGACRDDPGPSKSQASGGGKTAGIVVAMGDSLTAGYGVAIEESYPALLEKKLRAAGHPYQVINAGVSGETSSGALSRLEWVLTMKPDIVILETGANDGLRGIDPQVAEDNIRKMLTTLKEREITVVLAGMRMVRNLGPGYVARFNEIYPKLAGESDVIFMPFFLEGVAMVRQFNQEDGVHPNPAGYGKIVENLFPYVVRAIEKRGGSPTKGSP
jgi:acyl-CoA thioesterase-1